MSNNKLFGRAGLSALGVFIYVCLVSLILNNGQKIFGSTTNNILGPMIFLMLFVFSALITGFLIIGKPIMLYLDGLKKESIKLLFYTGLNLLILLLIVFLFLFLTK
jgi:hypothetical protein